MDKRRWTVADLVVMGCLEAEQKFDSQVSG